MRWSSVGPYNQHVRANEALLMNMEKYIAWTSTHEYIIHYNDVIVTAMASQITSQA